ncbi:MAG TPA: gamma-glutamyltransferase [Anaeromyxobacteraceae bacterium]
MLAPLLGLVLAGSAVSARGAVATAHPLASEAAAAVLRQGGNAADAAVAAAFVLGVVQNQSSGIGGGGFALAYRARGGEVSFLDFRETAPAAAAPGMFTRGGEPDPLLSRRGGLAVAVPGAVKGYAELARRFGTWRLPRLVEPAARIAERGFRVSGVQALLTGEALECLRADEAASRELLVAGPGGSRVPPAPGRRLVRRDLARTLRALGRDPSAFYRGPLAARVAAAVRAHGGVLAEADLAAYRVREREPLRGSYRGHAVVTAPPPSAGGAILLGLLAALDGEPRGAAAARDEAFLHAFAEVEKRLFARRPLLGDPDQVPGALAAARELASPQGARALRAQVGPRATPSAEIAPPATPARGGQTSHLSVVDAEGNAVALTTTVNRPFGACLLVPGTGILLNDEMDDFDAGAPAGAPNAAAPGKIPLSSMAPTLVFDAAGRLVLAVGSPGGATIPSTVAQVILLAVGEGMPLDQALGAPRIHHQWLPDVLLADAWSLDAATVRALEARGHVVRFTDRFPFGKPQAVSVDPATGLREAASEPRWEGRGAVP